jgi:hypothetical protein
MEHEEEDYLTASDCAAMIRAAKEGRAKLMVAYRLHYGAIPEVPHTS